MMRVKVCFSCYPIGASPGQEQVVGENRRCRRCRRRRREVLRKARILKKKAPPAAGVFVRQTGLFRSAMAARLPVLSWSSWLPVMAADITTQLSLCSSASLACLHTRSIFLSTLASSSASPSAASLGSADGRLTEQTTQYAVLHMQGHEPFVSLSRWLHHTINVGITLVRRITKIQNAHASTQPRLLNFYPPFASFITPPCVSQDKDHPRLVAQEKTDHVQPLRIRHRLTPLL